MGNTVDQIARKPLRKEEVTSLFIWLNIPRFVVPVVSGIVIAFLWFYSTLSFDARPVILGLLPFVLVVWAFWAAMIKMGMVSESLLLPQLLLDLLMVTVGVHLTGGLHSQFVYVYLLVVISASLVSFRATVTVGVAATLLYLFLGWVKNSGPPAGFSGMWSGFTNDDIIRIVIFVLIVGLISFQSNFYMTQIRKKDEEVLKLKDEFLFRTIHDLRSPSVVIRIILDKYGARGFLERYPEIRADLELLQKATSRMNGLIEDLLKIAKGEQGELTFRRDPIDLRAVIRDSIAELAPLMAEKKVVAAYAPPATLPDVVGDAEKLKEVFNNFLNNAVKYNREGGTIEVTHKAERAFLVTSIKDTGIGIKKENLSKLFTAYFRGDVDRSIQGTGLGLYFTKKLVEKMGGSIEVDSVVGTGTTFTIRLPIAA